MAFNFSKAEMLSIKKQANSTQVNNKIAICLSLKIIQQDCTRECYLIKCDQNEISRTNINKSNGITNLHRKVCKLRPSIVYVF